MLDVTPSVLSQFEQLRIATYARTCDYPALSANKDEGSAFERLELHKMPDTADSTDRWRVNRVVIVRNATIEAASPELRIGKVTTVLDNQPLSKALGELGRFEYNKKSENLAPIGKSAFELGNHHVSFFARIHGYVFSNHGEASPVSAGQPINDGFYIYNGSELNAPAPAVSTIPQNQILNVFFPFAAILVNPSALTLEDSIRYLEVRAILSDILVCLEAAEEACDNVRKNVAEANIETSPIWVRLGEIRSRYRDGLFEAAGMMDDIKKHDNLNSDGRESAKGKKLTEKVNAFFKAYGMYNKNVFQHLTPKAKISLHATYTLAYTRKIIPYLGEEIRKKCKRNPLGVTPIDQVITGMLLITSFHQLCNIYQDTAEMASKDGHTPEFALKELANAAQRFTTTAKELNLSEGQIESLKSLATTKWRQETPKVFLEIKKAITDLNAILNTMDPAQIAKKIEEVGSNANHTGLDGQTQLTFGDDLKVDVPASLTYQADGSVFGVLKKYIPFS